MKKIYLIAAVIALAAGVATYFFATELRNSKIVTGVDEATVLIALEDIDKDTILTKEMFQQVNLPETAASFGTVCNIDDVVGFMATEKIFKGEQLMSVKITPVGQENARDRLSYQIPEGLYAYTIYVEEENTVAYFIRENDIINIYNDASPSVEPLLKNVPVLKVGDYNANKQQETGTDILNYVSITVGLKKEQIPVLMGIEDPDNNSDKLYRIVLVPYAEGHGLSDDIVNAAVPETRNPEPATNVGMGEIATAASEEG